MTIASSGIYREASSNKTCPKRLLVWYSGELFWANSLCHSDSGTELLTHFDERGFGSGITYKSIEFKINALFHIFKVIVDYKFKLLLLNT